MSRKKKTNKQTENSPARRPKNKILIPFAFLAILAALIIIFSGDEDPVEQQTVNIELGGFQNDGTLTFIDSSGNDIVTIDIEIADELGEQQSGLMYREELGKLQGMLFIYDPARFQVFWMKNTFISLDIIFADKDGRIINFHEYTIPSSEQKYPSEGVSMYIVEVNAGFCEEYGINPGDRIVYSRN